MNESHEESVEELDLLAYADGRLDRDPARKATVEAYLQAHPEEAARIEAYLLQNNAIRAAYAGAGREPVPDRLLATLHRDPRARVRPLLRGAAAAAALALAASAGWWAGQSDRERPSLLTQSFVEQTMYGHFGATPATTGAEDAEQPLVSLSQRLSLELQPPDLSRFGFRQVDMRAIGSNGNGAVRVTYADASDRTINLFLRTRWQETAPAVNFVKRDGVSMAYWLDGPLVYGLAAQIGRGQLADIAAHIRQASRSSGGSLVGNGTEAPVVEHQSTVPAGAGQPTTAPEQELIVPRTPEEGGPFGDEATQEP